jgi:hypothetical protein
MTHPQAGLDTSTTGDLARLLFHNRRWPFAFRRIGNGEFPAEVHRLDDRSTGWFELY